MEEFYPMPVFVTLEVKNIETSKTWYEDALGFRSVFQSPPGSVADATMIHLRRDRHQDLLLFSAQEDSLEQCGLGVILNFLPGNVSVSDLAERAKRSGAPRVEGPIERPWNVREITVHDPDGYQIRFSEVLDVDKSFDEVVGQGWGEG
jgi:catechol 2,3-dioxygenase-like lactoylglutathione lyase family enzyme